MALQRVSLLGPKQPSGSTTGTASKALSLVGGFLGGAAGITGGPLGILGGFSAGAAAGGALGGAIDESTGSNEDHNVSLRASIEALRAQPEPVRREFSKPLVEAFIASEAQKKPKKQPTQPAANPMKRRFDLSQAQGIRG